MVKRRNSIGKTIKHQAINEIYNKVKLNRSVSKSVSISVSKSVSKASSQSNSRVTRTQTISDIGNKENV